MASLRDIKKGNISIDYIVKVFGENLLGRLRQASPELEIIGYSTSFVMEDLEFNYTIKEGKSSLARYNPFAKKIVFLHAATFDWPTAFVYGEEYKQTLGLLIPQMNKESGLRFTVKYC